ncbi:hypothetical protein [Streptomyces sp. NBC_00470]|uniref:hypothetical protein n=1 Tax=Streptomyces sp. NBC_00470 TaxID=2975753 RepID=UPI002F9148F7
MTTTPPHTTPGTDAVDAGPGPYGTTAPEDAEQRSRFLALPTVRRVAVTHEAAELQSWHRLDPNLRQWQSRTAAECWAGALAWDAADHPGPDPDTGEAAYVRTEAANARHRPNPDRDDRYTLCEQEWDVATWYRSRGKVLRTEDQRIRALPECTDCAHLHATQQRHTDA